MSKTEARNLKSLGPDANPASLRAARFVLADLQRCALDYVRAIAPAGPSTSAINILMNCLQTIDNLMAAGIPVEPAHQLMKGLYRRTL